MTKNKKFCYLESTQTNKYSTIHIFNHNYYLFSIRQEISGQLTELSSWLQIQEANRASHQPQEPELENISSSLEATLDLLEEVNEKKPNVAQLSEIKDDILVKERTDLKNRFKVNFS